LRLAKVEEGEVVSEVVGEEVVLEVEVAMGVGVTQGRNRVRSMTTGEVRG